MSIDGGPADLKVGSKQVYQVVKQSRQVWPPITPIQLSNFKSYKQVISSKKPVHPFFWVGTAYNNSAGYIEFNYSSELETIDVPNQGTMTIIEDALINVNFVDSYGTNSNQGNFEFFQEISNTFYDELVYLRTLSDINYPYSTEINFVAYYNGTQVGSNGYFECALKLEDYYGKLLINGMPDENLRDAAVSVYHMWKEQYGGGDYGGEPSESELQNVSFRIYNDMINTFNKTTNGQWMFYHQGSNVIPITSFESDNYIFYPTGTTSPGVSLKDWNVIYTADVSSDFYCPPYVDRSSKMYAATNAFSISYSTTYTSSGPSGFITVTVPSSNNSSRSFAYISGNTFYLCDGGKLPDIPNNSLSYNLNTTSVVYPLNYNASKEDTIPYTFNAYFNDVSTTIVSGYSKNNLYNPAIYKTFPSYLPKLVTHKYTLEKQLTTSSVNTKAWKWQLQSNSITVNLSSYSDMYNKGNVTLWKIVYTSWGPGNDKLFILKAYETNGIGQTNADWTVNGNICASGVYSRNATSRRLGGFYNDTFTFNTWNHDFSDDSGKYVSSAAYKRTNVSVNSLSIYLHAISNNTIFMESPITIRVYSWGDISSRGTRLYIENYYTASIEESLGLASNNQNATKTIYVWAFFTSGWGKAACSIGFTYLGSVQVKSVPASMSLEYSS